MIFSFYKIVGMLLDPVNLCVLFLFLAAITSFSKQERAARVARRFVAVLALLFLLCAVLPVGEWALMPLENKFPTKLPKRVDGILLLTGDENPTLSEARGVPVVGYSAQRYIYAARLAQRYPKAKIVVVGTTVPLFPSRKVKTRQISAEALKNIGIKRSRIIFEEESRTTHENAALAAKLIKPKKKETWILLTSAFHLPRAKLCFDYEKWKTIPVATDYLTRPKLFFEPSFNFSYQLRLLKTAAHEYVGLASYWLAGWIDKPW